MIAMNARHETRNLRRQRSPCAVAMEAEVVYLVECPFNPYKQCMLVRMRTTLNIDDAILEQASRLTGVREKTKLVRMGLESLVERESSRRLAKLGGTEPKLKSVPRRRSS